jgi:hypothetical protein
MFEMNRLQIQTPIRDQRADGGEVEEIESGKAPVGHKFRYKIQVARCKESYALTCGDLNLVSI